MHQLWDTFTTKDSRYSTHFHFPMRQWCSHKTFVLAGQSDAPEIFKPEMETWGVSAWRVPTLGNVAVRECGSSIFDLIQNFGVDEVENRKSRTFNAAVES
jgi:hypothetical protein